MTNEKPTPDVIELLTTFCNRQLEYLEQNRHLDDHEKNVINNYFLDRVKHAENLSNSGTYALEFMACIAGCKFGYSPLKYKKVITDYYSIKESNLHLETDLQYKFWIMCTKFLNGFPVDPNSCITEIRSLLEQGLGNYLDMWATLLQFKFNCYLRLKDFKNAEEIENYIYDCQVADIVKRTFSYLSGYSWALRTYDLQIETPIYIYIPEEAWTSKTELSPSHESPKTVGLPLDIAVNLATRGIEDVIKGITENIATQIAKNQETSIEAFISAIQHSKMKSDMIHDEIEASIRKSLGEVYDKLPGEIIEPLIDGETKYIQKKEARQGILDFYLAVERCLNKFLLLELDSSSELQKPGPWQKRLPHPSKTSLKLWAQVFEILIIQPIINDKNELYPYYVVLKKHIEDKRIRIEPQDLSSLSISLRRIQNYRNPVDHYIDPRPQSIERDDLSKVRDLVLGSKNSKSVITLIMTIFGSNRS